MRPGTRTRNVSQRSSSYVNSMLRGDITGAGKSSGSRIIVRDGLPDIRQWHVSSRPSRHSGGTAEDFHLASLLGYFRTCTKHTHI
jgi:hypothetical protein